jgi:hypothetical protein
MVLAQEPFSIIAIGCLIASLLAVPQHIILRAIRKIWSIEFI